MALFKILKGLSTNLMDQNSPTKKANEGWAYFTTNDGKFYIDIAGNGTQDAVIGTNRICLNAATADNVAHSISFIVNNGSNDTDVVYDGSSTAIIKFLNGAGITISAHSVNKGNITITNDGVLRIKGAGEQSYHSGDVTISAAQILGSTAIGSSTKPVYWTGSAFSTISSYEGNSATASKITDIGSSDAASSTATWRRVWFSYSDNTTGRPAYDDKLVYQTSTETLKASHFQAEHKSGGGNEFRVTYGSTIDMALMVGSGDANHGLYDSKASKWMIYADASGNVTVNGNATSATKATQDGSGNNIVNTYLTKAAGVTAVSWDSSNKKITRTINGTAADVVQFVAGSNVTLTGASGKITIAATDTVYTHPTYTAVSAAAVKVGRDSTGHVVIGSAITASDVGASSVTIRRWTA